jgi:hypothetical protein
MLLYEKLQTKDVLPAIPYVLWVHVQGITSLKHNQYTIILFIQASEHPRCGTRFGENCKTMKPSSGLSMLLSEEPHAMYVLPSISYVS